MDEIFVKMHVSARTTGFMAALGAELWQTLCCLATYMDSNGYCFPSIEEVAKELAISNSTARRRLKALCDFKWNGQPIVIRKIGRQSTGNFGNYRYSIQPTSQLSIFEGGINPRMDYKEYLKSHHWQVFRKKALKAAEYRCQLCYAANTVIDVHHKTYERLGRERLKDVIVLCRECHSKFHDKLADKDIDAAEEILTLKE